jgi:hypothetical protein
MRGFTGYPQISQWPHMAPVLGAQPLVGMRGSSSQVVAPPSTNFGAVSDAPGGPTAEERAGNLNPITPDVLPDALIGVGTAALSGAITGGVAAGTMRGAAIGAGVNAGAWSLFTVLGSWSVLDRTPKTVLSATAAIGLLGAGVLYFSR